MGISSKTIMKNVWFPAYVLLLVLLAGCGGKPREENTSERELRNAISEIITFVEVKDYDGLFEKYAAPKDLERMKSTGRLDKAIGRFSLWSKEMLIALKETQAIEPSFNSDSTRATFHVEHSPSDLVFRKINGRWYFAN